MGQARCVKNYRQFVELISLFFSTPRGTSLKAKKHQSALTLSELLC